MPASSSRRSLTPDEAVRRAKSMVGAPIGYVLGCGGRNPKSNTPATTREFGTEQRTGCDCVGFTAWSSGFDRFRHDFPYYGGWINTDSALGQWDGHTWHPAPGWFELLAAPEPGAWVCYPSIDLDHDGQRDRIGHVGIVSDASGWTTAKWAGVKVVQCSSSASRRTGRAIVETDATLWGMAEWFQGQHEQRWRAAFLRPL